MIGAKAPTIVSEFDIVNASSVTDTLAVTDTLTVTDPLPVGLAWDANDFAVSGKIKIV